MEPIQTPKEGTEPQAPQAPESNAALEQAISASDEAIARADAEKADTEEQPSVEPEPEPEAPEQPQDPLAQGEDPAPTSENPAAEPDYRNKFQESSREAMLLVERNKVKDAQIEQLTKTDTPTDDDMRQAFPEWDQLDALTKKVISDQETIKRRQNRIDLELAEGRNQRQLEAELEGLSDQEEFKDLQGKETDFKRFALKPANKGIPAASLAKIFLHDIADELPKKHEYTPKPGLEPGSGGPKAPEKPTGLTLEQEAALMHSDPGKYAELVKKGVI